MRHVLPCAVLLLMASAPATFAAQPVTFFGEQKVPLLYQILHTSPTSAAPGALQSNVRQVYVFRDGTVLVSVDGVSEELSPTGGILSGQAPALQMQGLNQALEAAQAGIQGDCHIDLGDQFLEHWHFRYTWFGRGRRQNTFEATDKPGPPCPLEVRQLQDSLQFVINATSLTTLFGQ